MKTRQAKPIKLITRWILCKKEYDECEEKVITLYWSADLQLWSGKVEDAFRYTAAERKQQRKVPKAFWRKEQDVEVVLDCGLTT